jgi:nucleoside-diphosphate-sugar epimerase
MKNTIRTALVIGATGSLGRAAAAALLRRGWQVRALHRDPHKAAAATGLPLQWLQGDAMNLGDVIDAAQGTEVIVHATNPPNYRNWRGLALPMLNNTIAAAKAHNARIVLPATVYNFGKNSARVLQENSPQIPTTRKGQVRVEMELMLQKASIYGVRSIVVRAGDFFGPDAGNSWLTRGMVRARGRTRWVFYPGPRDIGHSWAYLPDLAETIARLVECEQPMSAYEVFHFRGHWFERGAQMAEQVCRVLGINGGAIKSFPWWLVRVAAPLLNVFREMLEMRYLWQIPLELDNAKLIGILGCEPHTAIETALAATLCGNERGTERIAPIRDMLLRDDV